MNNNCTDLYLLSTIACRLTECIEEKELEALSADLLTIADMFTSLLAHQSICKIDDCPLTDSSTGDIDI